MRAKLINNIIKKTKKMDTAPINAITSVNSDTSSAQNTLNRFFQGLENAGFTPDQLEKMGQYLLVIIDEHTMFALTSLMDEQDMKDWNTFVASKPNDAQQLLVMDGFCKKKTGKTLEDFQDEIIERAVMNTLDQLNNTPALAEKVAKLSDEQVKQALDFMTKGEFSEADKIINQLQ